jgi:dihydroorotase-like cyclic amidohydrolase
VKTLIRDATVVLPTGCQRINVLVNGSKIAALDSAVHSTADEVISARGLHCCPA